MNEITAFIKEAQRTPLPFHQVRTHEKMVIYGPESRLSPDTKSADALILDFPGSSESESVSCSVVSDSLPPHGPHGTRALLEWVAFPFSRRSSPPMYQTQVSHIAGTLSFEPPAIPGSSTVRNLSFCCL